MSKKLMQFYYPKIKRGIQVELVFCTTTKKNAAKLLDISTHLLNTYGSCIEPTDEICVDNPNILFSKLNSGELWKAKPEWINKLIKYTDLCQYINEHRKVYSSYIDFEKKNKK